MVRGSIYVVKGGQAVVDYKILAIDFDGTISLGIWPEVDLANDRLMSFSTLPAFI